MNRRCQCQKRVRTLADGVCVNSDSMCKVCILEEQARIDKATREPKPKVVDQTVESNMSVDSKVEEKVGVKPTPTKEEVKNPPVKSPYGSYHPPKTLNKLKKINGI